ncbi:hypothetical protein BsWGS_22295 [Bradybaena similaris]
MTRTQARFAARVAVWLAIRFAAEGVARGGFAAEATTDGAEGAGTRVAGIRLAAQRRNRRSATWRGSWTDAQCRAAPIGHRGAARQIFAAARIGAARIGTARIGTARIGAERIRAARLARLPAQRSFIPCSWTATLNGRTRPSAGVICNIPQRAPQNVILIPKKTIVLANSLYFIWRGLAFFHYLSFQPEKNLQAMGLSRQLQR